MIYIIVLARQGRLKKLDYWGIKLFSHTIKK